MWNNDAFQEALFALSATTFTVYAYLGMYKEMKEPFALSKTAVVNALNISEGTYHKAIKELQEKGYIIPDRSLGDNTNSYVFLEGKNQGYPKI